MERQKLIERFTNKIKGEYDSIIRQITGNALKPFQHLTEIEQCVQKFNTDLINVLFLNDKVVTLSMIAEIVRTDKKEKITKAIQQIKR